jgi:hypothetical protein
MTMVPAVCMTSFLVGLIDASAAMRPTATTTMRPATTAFDPVKTVAAATATGPAYSVTPAAAEPNAENKPGTEAETEAQDDSEVDPPDEPDAPLRLRYPTTVTAAWGYNSLEGLGVRFGYQVNSTFAVDSGLGLSLAGFTTGTQIRLNIWDSSLTPYVAVGGHTHLASETEYLDEDGFFVAQGHPAAFADLTVGGNYQGDDGLSVTLSLGYALLLTHRPYTVVTGVPTAIGRETVAAQYGGGLSCGMAVGYAF